MLDARTKQVYIDKAKDPVVAALEVTIPDDAGGLWEALKMSGGVESSLGVPSETNPSDDKYLRSLAETYENDSSWDTRRQVLSIYYGRSCSIQSPPAVLTRYNRISC